MGTVSRGARVGVLQGGLSTEAEVSRKTGAAVLAALHSRGWDAVAIEADRELPQRIAAAAIDVAWVALHGRYGEDGCVQGLLELLGLPYTGSGVLASAVAMDKIATKRLVRHLSGVHLAPDAVLRPGDPLPEGLALPVVVKPAGGGSTLGMSLVRHASELSAALDAASAGGERVLVEQAMPGVELTVAVLDDRALPVVRIQPEDGFFDFEAKYRSGRTHYEVPAAIPDAVRDAVQGAAVAVHRALGCRGLTRSDFLLQPDGRAVFLEINTLPGMTATSLSPMAARATGMSFEALVEHLLLSACTGA